MRFSRFVGVSHFEQKYENALTRIHFDFVLVYFAPTNEQRIAARESLSHPVKVNLASSFEHVAVVSLCAPAVFFKAIRELDKSENAVGKFNPLLRMPGRGDCQGIEE